MWLRGACAETLLRASLCVRGRVPKDGDQIVFADRSSRPDDQTAYVCVGDKLTGDDWETFCGRCGQTAAEGELARVLAAPEAGQEVDEAEVIVRATLVDIADHLAVAGSFGRSGDNSQLKKNFEAALTDCTAEAVPNDMKPVVNAM